MGAIWFIVPLVLRFVTAGPPDKQLQHPFPQPIESCPLPDFGGFVLQQRFADEEFGFSKLCFGYLDLTG
jgi:hypothetical protein